MGEVTCQPPRSPLTIFRVACRYLMASVTILRCQTMFAVAAPQVLNHSGLRVIATFEQILVPIDHEYLATLVADKRRTAHRRLLGTIGAHSRQTTETYDLSSLLFAGPTP